MTKHLEENLLLPKYKKTIQNKRARDKLLLLAKVSKTTRKAAKIKRPLIPDKISQASQHAKALQKSSKLKTSSGSQLYGNISNRLGQLLLSS